MDRRQAVEPIITFIIPVRHPANAKDWDELVVRLSQTSHSIAAQTNPNWRAIIVANNGADFSKLPDKFEVVRVDFPPNPIHEINPSNREAALDAFRLDKGRRVLVGMLAAGPTSYFMIVDDDDFVSREIVDYAASRIGSPGWSIVRGYVWAEGGRLVLKHYWFVHVCGTSHIVRSDLYELPPSFEAASEDYIKSMLGSHVQIDQVLAERGVPLEPLPFPGAVYRVGHAGAHSQSQGIVQTYLLDRSKYSRRQAFENFKQFRLVTPGFVTRFGMQAAWSSGVGMR